MALHKRKQIEERLGCSLRAYLRSSFLKNAVQREVARELGLDHATIRYYIKKWDLPWGPKAWRGKERKEGKIKLKAMPRTHKRKLLEEWLGQPLRTYLKDRFLERATQMEIARELGVDHSAIRYYRKKWNLSYDPKLAGEKKMRTAKIERNHLEVCICAICKYRFCEEARESHKRGRCVMWCRSFKGKITGSNLLRAKR